MPAISAVWAVALIVVLAVGLLLALLLLQRPERGWGSWLRENLGAGRGRGAGVIAEHREAADGETVLLEELFADAEAGPDQAPAYVAVPERFETRFNELAEQLSGQLSEHLGDQFAGARAGRGREEETQR